MRAWREVGPAKLIRFVLMTLAMGIYPLMFLPPLRWAFLRLLGADVRADAVLQNVRFYNLYRTGLRGLTIGHRCYVGNEVLLDMADRILIEDEVTLAARVHILTHTNPGYADHPLQKHLPSMQAPVHLRRGAFVGANAVIAPGVTVGECAVVGAGAVVTRDVPAYTVVAGVPAKPLRKLGETKTTS